MRVEKFDQFGEVGKRTRQSVYFVDDDLIDLAGSDTVQQPLERRPLLCQLIASQFQADQALA